MSNEPIINKNEEDSDDDNEDDDYRPENDVLSGKTFIVTSIVTLDMSSIL